MTPEPAPRHTRATHPGPVDVLVAHAFYMALDPKQVERRRPFPPLGTLYAAAVLRDRGYRVAVFDAMRAPDETAFDVALRDHPPRLVALFEDSFNFLSKMCLGRMRHAALAMIAAARAAGIPVLVAGSDATDRPEAYLEAGAAAVILGEGEHALADAAATLLGGPVRPTVPDHARQGDATHLGDVAMLGDVPMLADVAGLALVDPSSGAVVRTAPRAPERVPDVFPWPARDLVDVAGYRRAWYAAHGHFALNMVSTRGCPFHCNWCAKPIWGQRYAQRSPADVAAEMAAIKRAYAPDRVWFADDIFGLREAWTVEFAQEVRRLGARIPFQIQSRVDLMTPAAVRALAEAGCCEAWLGVESGSQRILDAMEKGTRVEDVPAAVDRLRSCGIRVGLFLQLGYPGEAWEDILATAALVRSVLPDAIGVSVSYPLPGTPFHARVAAELGPKRNWDDSRDLAMLFEGTYTTDFYRALHGLLHDELAARLAAARATDADASRRAGAALASAMAGWAGLARRERAARAAKPTPAAWPASAPRPPDLSRMSN